MQQKGNFIFSCVNNADIANLESYSRDNSITPYYLNGENIKDKRSFFEEVARQLPYESSGNLTNPVWDALIDNLYNGLTDQPSVQVAIVWTSADVILRKDFQLFLNITECLSSPSC